MSAHTGIPLEFVVPRLHKTLSKKESFVLEPRSCRVKPYKVLEATYKEAFAALRTAIIKQPFRNPGSPGIFALITAIITIDEGLDVLFGREISDGSFHETLR